MNRREFSKLAGLTSVAAMTNGLPLNAVEKVSSKVKPLSVHVFSKHLQFLDYGDMAKAAKDIGFDGVDLTVRPKGHVEPENVVKDLPRAVAAIREAGLQAVMMTSDVNNVDDPVNVQVLKTAAEQGIKYYRTAYYKFPKDGGTYRQNLDIFKAQFDALGKMNSELGLHGAYQNHAGTNLGSYITDIAYLLEGNDPRWLGCQYDIRHATVEGGTAWPLGLRWVKDHIKFIAIKDFAWGEKNGKPWPENVPMGEGVVDFKELFKQFREYKIHPEVSLHYEYDMGGADKGAAKLTWPKEKVFEAMRKDLDYLHKAWNEA